jgi:Phage integrase, N-terminal SAM-like domain
VRLTAAAYHDYNRGVLPTGNGGARLRADELARAGAAPSAHTVASYERRWRQWQAFADHHGVAALPADPMHVAAFVVARYRAG